MAQRCSIAFSSIWRVLLVILIFSMILHNPAEAQATRDPWQWPFASTSIWNTPLGNGALYAPSGIPVPTSGYGTYEDEDILLTTGPADPLVDWYQLDGGYYQGQIYFPDSIDVPQTTNNNAAAVLQPDGQYLKQMQPLFHVAGSGRIDANPVHPYNTFPETLFGDGFWGGHSGSGLSSMGGTIRTGELTGPGAIRHALKIEAWGQHLFYNHSASAAGYGGAVAPNTGYRWPAIANDGGAEDPTNFYNGYNGTLPDVTMGSLIAIPPYDANGQPITESSLGLTTAPAKKLFHALQDYGAYMCDNSAGDAVNFCTQRAIQGRPGVTDELATAGFQWSSGALHDDIFRMIPALNVVQNNAQNNVGGGGTPRQPAAPPFAYGGWKAGTSLPIAASTVTTVEAENYDVGGAGVSYYSGDPVNHGGAYRFDGVSVYSDGAASNALYVGWIYPGQWMGYTINVAQAGTYSLSARVSSGAGGGSFHLEFGPVGQVGGSGVMSSVSFAVPSTGSWSNFIAVAAPAVSLPAGTQWMRFVADTNGYNADNFSLVPVASGATLLTGTVFSDGAGPWQGIAANACPAAFDGKTTTFYDCAKATGGFVGIDAGTAPTVTKIVYAPRPGCEKRMVGGVFEGSNTSATAGYTTLATVMVTPKDGLVGTLSVTSTTAYRWLRYRGPANSYCNVAEIQFRH